MIQSSAANRQIKQFHRSLLPPPTYPGTKSKDRCTDGRKTNLVCKYIKNISNNRFFMEHALKYMLF